MQLKAKNRIDSRGGNEVPFVILVLLQVALVQDVVPQKTLLFVQLRIIPVVP